MRDATAKQFRQLHQTHPGFIMPNAWDVGSAVILASVGFQALGTTSAGIAFSLGKQDYSVNGSHSSVSREQMLARAAEIAAAVTIPVNVDLEAGYGDSPERVAETIKLAIDAGLCGANIEDKIPYQNALYDSALAIERIQAAKEAIVAARSNFVLTARSDALIWSEQGLAMAIERSNLYHKAGADCLFTPGISDIKLIATLANEIKGPLNMVMGLNSAEGNAYEWLKAGVQRISIGGSLARSVYGLVQRSGNALLTLGSIDFAQQQLTHSELNAIFSLPPTY